MTADLSDEHARAVAARLARRYPRPRVPKPVMIVVVGVLTAGALGWLVWTALVHARPQVVAQVAAYQVVSDRRIDVTITVDRRDPSRRAVCRVIAQATDFQPVAEEQVPVPATIDRVVNLPIQLVTLRRATSATVKGCTTV